MLLRPARSVVALFFQWAMKASGVMAGAWMGERRSVAMPSGLGTLAAVNRKIWRN
jgi:hypothetical protein